MYTDVCFQEKESLDSWEELVFLSATRGAWLEPVNFTEIRMLFF